ncbi:MAG: non-canonical purine NTP pyrophosphatase [candidate division SR1 bacterium]|nr:non-canonical purine NTP pyrophosphatase [candidate division SR1 bacterium]
MLYFVTGNKNKFKECQSILGTENVEQLDIDLDEIQETDPYKIIRHKLQEALKKHPGPLMIEDTSLYMESPGGALPGPFIKRFLKEIKNEGLYGLAKNAGKYKAKATVLIGYAKNKDEIEFFEGSVEGTIVEPTHPTDFGRDPLFQPDGYDKSYAAMSREEKNEISMRRIALNKLKIFLEKNLK